MLRSEIFNQQSPEFGVNNQTLRSNHAEKAIFQVLDEVRIGCIEVTNYDNVHYVFGDVRSELRAHLVVLDQRFFRAVLTRASLGLGEAYSEGWYEIENDKLVDFLGIILLNKLYERIKGSLNLLLTFALERLLASPRFLICASQNVRHHYDLSNEFFKLMLDDTMAYSCGYQQSQTDSLEDLQIQKYDRICRKLNLKKGGTILDIGSGWGGLLLHAAQQYPNIYCHGITLSPSQRELALARVKERKVEDRILIDLLDYRQLNSTYDFIVSVGMLEHVGRESYRLFIRKIHQCLKENGIGLLHTIGSLEPPSAPVDSWTAKYIFPGYYLPRLDMLTTEMQAADLLVVHIENLKPHYAITLSKWRERVNQNRMLIRRLGSEFNNRFFRTWNYYLQSSEAGFRYGEMQLYQILFTKGHGGWNLPMNLEWSD